MTFASRLLFWIALLSIGVGSATAADFTYKEYRNASESWKRGFVLGIAQYMSTVAQPDEEAPYHVRNAFQRCLAASTDVHLVRHIEAYVARNAASVKGPMIAVVMRAFFDLCRSEIEGVQLPKTAPSRR